MVYQASMNVCVTERRAFQRMTRGKPFAMACAAPESMGPGGGPGAHRSLKDRPRRIGRIFR